MEEEQRDMDASCAESTSLDCKSLVKATRDQEVHRQVLTVLVFRDSEGQM